MTKSFIVALLLALSAGLTDCSPDAADSRTTGPATAPPTAAAPAASRAGFVEATQLLLQRLDTLPLTGNRDHDFALILALHHRAALRLARLELEHGRDSTLRDVARALRTNGPLEIQQLQLATARLTNPARSYNPRNAHDAFVRRSAAATDTLLQPIGALTGDADQDFATMLLAYHRAVVVLAQAEVALGRDAGMKQLAQSIIGSRPTQVSRLRRWRAAKNKALNPRSN